MTPSQECSYVEVAAHWLVLLISCFVQSHSVAPAPTLLTPMPGNSLAALMPYRLLDSMYACNASPSHFSSPSTVAAVRTEAASNVLKSSAARQRSYVLSAAKKYEWVAPPTYCIPPYLCLHLLQTPCCLSHQSNVQFLLLPRFWIHNLSHRSTEKPQDAGLPFVAKR